MNIMIASDIHGSAYYCSKLMEAFEREGADRLLLLGDLLYHGPRNDLPRDYAPKEVLHMLNEKKQKIFCVRGNCDTEVDQMVLEFPILADYAILEAETRLIYATHGHVFHLQHLPMLQPGDLSISCTEAGVLSRLCPAELAQIRDWKPQTIGQILFNQWD